MPKRLARPDELLVGHDKLVNYLLNSQHPDGRTKARFFVALGFDAMHWRTLADALKRHGRERDIVHEQANAYGTKYVVRCNLTTPAGASPCINTVWIAEGTSPPRLITAYPASAK